MPSILVIKSIGLLIVSFLVGIGYFFIQSEQTKELRKKQLEVTSSLIINIVIYIWIGKVLVNLPEFFSDPLAILAYPSNSNAFYVASGLGLINIIINVTRNKVALSSYIKAFIPIFIGESLLFEFVHYIQNGTINNLTNLLILILLVGIQLIFNKQPIVKLNLIIAIILSTVQLGFSLIYYYTMIFNYLIYTIFFIFFFYLLYL